MSSTINVFVAGSKELKNERMVCRSVCNSLQNQFGAINTLTFEDFPEAISSQGHQKQYNLFIKENADIVVFIFSRKVGDITMSEFSHACEAFNQNNKPQILVYIDKDENATSDQIEMLKNMLAENGQYYKEYLGVEELERMLEKHLTKILVDKIQKDKDAISETSSSFLSFLGVPLAMLCGWLILSLIGGIFMYFYDMNMSDKDCLNLAINNVEYRRGGELMYCFPDEIYIYDITNKSLEILNRKNAISSVDISMPKIEHVALGTTTTLLLTRLLKVKPKGNGKTILAYVAAAATCAVGFGVGCVVEQMLYPPQYSKPMRRYLAVSDNWETINIKRNPSSWF